MTISIELATTICLIIGAIISAIVSGLKNLAFVKNHPKVVAGILSVLTTLVITAFGDMPQEGWKMIVVCIVTQFSAAIATHEAVVHPLQGKG